MRKTLILTLTGLILSLSNLNANSVWFLDTCVVPNDTLTLTLYAQIDEPGAMAVELNLSFPSQYATYIGYDTDGTLIQGWMVATNDSPPGSLRIAAANTTRVSGVGSLIILQFTVNEGFSDSMIIYLSGVFDNTPFPDTSKVLKLCPFGVEEYGRTLPYPRLDVHPNPFRREVRISLVGMKSQRTKLEIFDAQGRWINTIELGSNGTKIQGSWDGRNWKGKRVSRGIYLLHLPQRDIFKPILYAP